MASSPQKQMEFVMRVASSQNDRARFLADPAAFAEKRKVALDDELMEQVISELQDVERRAAALGLRNRALTRRGVKIPGLRFRKPAIPAELADSPVGVAAWPLVAYYVVTTAAAVVSAVSTTYMATKWFKGLEM